jgi:O-antigen/teichoic acid export membrane protein
VQAAYAILISKELGPSSYGIFASITALSIIGSVFSGWGCDQILIKNVSIAKEKFQKNFGSGLVLILITYPILLLIIFTISYILLHKSEVNSLSLILFITADLLFTKTLFFAKACFVVFERAKGQLVINLVTTLTKLFFLLLALKFSTTFTLDQWAIWYFASGLLSAGFSLFYVVHHLGYPQFGILKSEFVSGMQFCIEQASLASLKDLDKPIIVAMMGAEQGGYYAAAFKLVDAASSPVRGMLYAVYVRYFKESQNGEKAGIAFAFKVLPFLIAASLIIGILIYSLAWTLPLLLGPKYQPSVDIVKQLWLYPLLIGLLGTGIDLLRSIGRQLARTYIMILSSLLTAPIVYVALNYFGIAGAAYAKIFVLVITVATAWRIIYIVKSKHEY